MSQRDDALDRYLDSLCAGVPARTAPAGLDAPLAATARQVLGKSRPAPSPAFLASLEAALVARSHGAAARVPGWDRSPAPPRLRLAALAAVLVLFLGTAMTSVIGGNQGADRLFFLPAATSAAPPPAAIDVNPNDDLSSGSWLWAFPDSALPTPTILPDHQ